MMIALCPIHLLHREWSFLSESMPIPAPVLQAEGGRKSIQPVPLEAPVTALAQTKSAPTPDPFLTVDQVSSLPTRKFSPQPDITASPMMSKFSTKSFNCLALVGVPLHSIQLFCICCLNNVVLVKSHENDVSCFVTGCFYERAVADFDFLRCHQ